MGNIGESTFTQVDNDKTMGSGFKLKEGRFRLDMSCLCFKYIFFRVVGFFLLLLFCLFSMFTTMLQLASHSVDNFFIAHDMVIVCRVNFSIHMMISGYSVSSCCSFTWPVYLSVRACILFIFPS